MHIITNWHIVVGGLLGGLTAIAVITIPWLSKHFGSSVVSLRSSKTFLGRYAWALPAYGLVGLLFGAAFSSEGFAWWGVPIAILAAHRVIAFYRLLSEMQAQSYR